MITNNFLAYIKDKTLRPMYIWFSKIKTRHVSDVTDDFDVPLTERICGEWVVKHAVAHYPGQKTMLANVNVCSFWDGSHWLIEIGPWLKK